MALIAKRLSPLILVFATIGCDRVTKHIAVAALAEAPRQSFLADTVRLEYIENNVGVGPLRTGVFNIADMAITLGVVLMIVARGRAAEGRA